MPTHSGNSELAVWRAHPHQKDILDGIKQATGSIAVWTAAKS